MRSVRHCTGQVATDPQSPKGGSQRACPLGVPTPRLLGVSQRWRCSSSRTLLWQLRPLSLRVASPGSESSPFSDRSLGRRPSVTLFQRGTGTENTLKWTVFIQHLSHDQWRAEHTAERFLRLDVADFQTFRAVPARKWACCQILHELSSTVKCLDSTVMALKN